MTLLTRIASLAFTVSLAACIMPELRMPTSSGRPINTQYVKTIEKGTTTMSEVRANLGEPASVTTSPDSELWAYSHWEGKPAMFGQVYSSSSTQTLTIQFKNGKVVDYNFMTARQ